MCPATGMTTNIDSAGAFIADYAAALWRCGATCLRTEKNVGRIAGALGVEATVEILPRYVHVILADGSVLIRPVGKGCINFDINTRLSRLSWDLADGKITLEDAGRRLSEITRAPATGGLEMLVLTTLANAAFCRIFGGDAVAVLLVIAATAIGFRLRQMMLADGRDVRLTFICAAFVSAAISAAGHVFAVGATPEIAVGTSVLYLIPGVPYINSVSDMIGRHYLCAMSRFLDACVLTCCLSVGLCAGMFILGLEWF